MAPPYHSPHPGRLPDQSVVRRDHHPDRHHPQGALYADRDFLWRLSSATVDLDESDFTPSPTTTGSLPLSGERWN